MTKREAEVDEALDKILAYVINARREWRAHGETQSLGQFIHGLNATVDAFNKMLEGVVMPKSEVAEALKSRISSIQDLIVALSQEIADLKVQLEAMRA